MNIFGKTFLFSLAVMALPAAAFSQVNIGSIEWQKGRALDKKHVVYAQIKELSVDKQGKIQDKFRALVEVKNSGATAAEGLVLRYAVSMRMVKPGDSTVSVWSVPFHVEELRISKINPGMTHVCKVIRFDLAERLKRLKGTGFYIDSIKIHLMLEPRAGSELSALTQESVLPVTGF